MRERRERSYLKVKRHDSKVEELRWDPQLPVRKQSGAPLAGCAVQRSFVAFERE